MAGSRERLVLLGIGLCMLVVSGLHPFDRTTWFLEVGRDTHRRADSCLHLAPVPVDEPQLSPHPLPRPRARCSGGHYTYEKVPIGFWFKDAFDLSRNHYDRFGHLLQGFVPAIVAREILLRLSPVRPGVWLFALVVSVCLAISARSMSCSNGWQPYRFARAPMLFSLPRETPGIRRKTCF